MCGQGRALSGVLTVKLARGERRVCAVEVSVVAAVVRAADVSERSVEVGRGVVFVGAELMWVEMSSGTRAGVTPSMSFHAGRRRTVVALGGWLGLGSGHGMSDAESIRCC